MGKPVGSVNLSAAELEQLRQFAGGGSSRVEAARRLGRSPSTVIRRVKVEVSCGGVKDMINLVLEALEADAPPSTQSDRSG